MRLHVVLPLWGYEYFIFKCIQIQQVSQQNVFCARSIKRAVTTCKCKRQPIILYSTDRVSKNNNLICMHKTMYLIHQQSLLQVYNYITVYISHEWRTGCMSSCQGKRLNANKPPPVTFPSEISQLNYALIFFFLKRWRHIIWIYVQDQDLEMTACNVLS